MAIEAEPIAEALMPGIHEDTDPAKIAEILVPSTPKFILAPTIMPPAASNGLRILLLGILLSPYRYKYKYSWVTHLSLLRTRVFNHIFSCISVGAPQHLLCGGHANPLLQVDYNLPAC
jgi:hypothetical protein